MVPRLKCAFVMLTRYVCTSPTDLKARHLSYPPRVECLLPCRPELVSFRAHRRWQPFGPRRLQGKSSVCCSSNCLSMRNGHRMHAYVSNGEECSLLIMPFPRSLQHQNVCGNADFSCS